MLPSMSVWSEKPEVDGSTTDPVCRWAGELRLRLRFTRLEGKPACATVVQQTRLESAKVQVAAIPRIIYRITDKDEVPWFGMSSMFCNNVTGEKRGGVGTVSPGP